MERYAPRRTEFEFPILENRQVGARDFLLTIRAEPDLVSEIKPGQFAMLRPRASIQFDPLLLRPFAIFDAEGERVSFLYRIYRRGTNLLRNLKDTVYVLMPLGKPIKDDARKYLFIAGGIGVAGLFYSAKVFKRKGKKVKLLYGEKSKEDLSALSFIEKESIDCTVFTEDGSFGEKGLVTDALEDFKDYRWIACGPVAMLKEVKTLAEKLNTECFLSLDTRMACGVGACLGCVVKTRNGYKRCCVDGPVFDAKEVIL